VAYGRSNSPSKRSVFKNRKAAEIAAEAAAAGITPVELMLNAMREYNDEAEEAFACAKEAETEKIREDLRSYGRSMIQMACEVAKDVAPYIHPRLNSTTLLGDPEAPLQVELRRADHLKSLIRGR
jgi:hypothetical protein